MVFDHLSRKQVNVSLKALSLKSRITLPPASAESTSKPSSSEKDASSSKTSSSKISQAIITEASTKPTMISNYPFFKWHSRSKRAELINGNGSGQLRHDAQKPSEFVRDKPRVSGLNTHKHTLGSSYTDTNNAFEKYENDCGGDNWTDSSTDEESKYNFLSTTRKRNDRGERSCRRNIQSLHNQRPLSTATILSDSSICLLGGAEKEVVKSDCIQLNTTISTCASETSSKSTTQRDDSNAISIASIPTTTYFGCNNIINSNTNNNNAAALEESQISCSSSSKRLNETKPSSLSSLPFTLDSSSITFTTSPLLVNSGDSCQLATSIWSSGCNTNRNVNANSSRASSLLYSASNEMQSSHSRIVNTFPCNYYASPSSEETADLSFSNRQRNKRKAKCRVRAENKTVLPSESPSQSATSVQADRSLSCSGTTSENKLPRQSRTKRSYLNYIRKFRQFRYNLSSGGSSTKVNKKPKNKLSLRKVGDLQWQLKGKVGENSEETPGIMESQERNNNNNCCEIHIKHPAIKITVSPDTPDVEHVSNIQQSVDMDLVTNSAARNSLMGNFFDNNTFSVEDFARLEFPNCVDFGITDFLCCKDEVDVDLSSDTDTSFLEATPPHRFSDSELEQIETMSITLDTALNLNSKIDSLLINHVEGHDDTKKTISAPPEMESVEAQEILDRDFILALKQMQANNLIKNTGTTTNSDIAPRKVLPKPFRRHISLPATIFMSYIFDQGNKTGASPKDLTKSQRTERLPKIDSLSCGSTENIYDGSSFSNDSMESVSDAGDWVSKANSSVDLEHDDFENQAFTSELEKRSLIVRHMRKLIRQDTSGNFAPPDFCI